MVWRFLLLTNFLLLVDEFRGNNMHLDTSHVEGQRGGTATFSSGSFLNQLDSKPLGI